MRILAALLVVARLVVIAAAILLQVWILAGILLGEPVVDAPPLLR